MTQAIQNVSDTAFLVARFRAAETVRPPRLFYDPLAAGADKVRYWIVDHLSAEAARFAAYVLLLPT
jgi:O-methyltransferase involved in polyketide biosynthesis